MGHADIRVIAAPKVYLLGRQVVDDAELCRFLADEGIDGWTTDAPTAAEKLVEISGRVCYLSFNAPRPGGNKTYIENILEHQHGSVLEHAVWTMLITGVSRTLTHELVRHRVGLSPSQLSQRYVDESDVAFVVPPALLPAINGYLGSPDSKILADAGWWRAAAAWVGHCAACLDAYASLLPYLESIGPLGNEHKTARRKAARESARSVLPGCAESKIVITGNARAYRHLIELRGSAGADAEMRRLALALLAVLRPDAPAAFGDFTEAGDGSLVAAHHKV
jgi:thymidylate synthase (FAD)